MHKVHDPVCGMAFDKAEAACVHEHRGIAYHFCSPSCEAAFRRDPDRYAEPPVQPAVPRVR